jgi:hypothetical protein
VDERKDVSKPIAIKKPARITSKYTNPNSTNSSGSYIHKSQYDSAQSSHRINVLESSRS